MIKAATIMRRYCIHARVLTPISAEQARRVYGNVTVNRSVRGMVVPLPFDWDWRNIPRQIARSWILLNP
ncbi:hypothetical protein ACQR3P_00605 [Rhodococcus sp. IEGM1300]